ncbi:ribonuclease H family protein [Bacteroidales bacterium OttesenSCG-928-A17]|nr:ribonuclease H family protein [Bacteroidales bacterium OttesenSCG-928-A17]
MPKQKWYVVWKGKIPGIYDSWVACKSQTEGFEGALYRAFESRQKAEEAYRSNPWSYMGGGNVSKGESAKRFDGGGIVQNSLAVDAACSGNPGVMEYRGVYTATGEEIFHSPCFQNGTNNIGEFLALVHGLALLKKQNSTIPVYSDSVNAITWVRNKKCKTKLEPNEQNADLFELIDRAEIWLKNNDYGNTILKWDTKNWGEIPADFGRK